MYQSKGYRHGVKRESRIVGIVRRSPPHVGGGGFVVGGDREWRGGEG